MSVLDVFGVAFESTGAEKVQEDTDKVQNGFADLAKQLAGAVAGFKIVKTLFSAGLGFAKQGEDLAFMAAQAGTSTESIERLGIALSNYGGGVSSASATLAKLNQQMQDMKFGKQSGLTDAAITYGLDLNASDAEGMLVNIAKRMEGLNQQQQIALGNQIGLDPATLMLVQQGVAGVKKELQDASKFTVFRKEDIENSRKLQIAYREWQAWLDKIRGIFQRELIPIITRFFRILNEGAEWLAGKQGLIIGVMTAIVAGALALSGAFSPITAIITGIGTALFLLLDDFVTWKNGGVAALGVVYEWIEKNIDSIKTFAMVFGGLVLAAFAPVTAIITGALAAINAFFDSMGMTAQEKLTFIKDFLVEFVSFFGNVFYSMGESWGKTLAGIVIFFTDTIPNAIKALAAPFNWLSEKLGKVMSWFGGDEEVEKNVNIGQEMVGSANATPLNSMTTSQMTMMTNNNNTTPIKVDNVTINTQATDGAAIQQSFTDWTSGVAAQYGSGVK